MYLHHLVCFYTNYFVGLFFKQIIRYFFFGLCIFKEKKMYQNKQDAVKPKK
jgi:hypothetical protein